MPNSQFEIEDFGICPYAFAYKAVKLFVRISKDEVQKT